MIRIASAADARDPGDASARRMLGIAPAGACLGWLVIVLIAYAFQIVLETRVLEFDVWLYDSMSLSVSLPVLICWWLAFPLLSIAYFLLRGRSVSLGQRTLVWLHVWLSILSQALLAMAVTRIAGLPFSVFDDSEGFERLSAFLDAPLVLFVVAQTFFLGFLVLSRRRV